MTTATRFGALPLPVPAPVAGEAAGDPALTVVLDYLKTVLNARAGTVWGQIAPARGALVKSVYTHDPDELDFVEPQTPSLYAWREEGSSEQIAADYRIEHSKIVLLWVAPPDNQNSLRPRVPYANALAKVVETALTLGCDPTWVAAGDTDPRAATEGSLIWELAGFWHLGKVSWKRAVLEVKKAAGEPARYPALRFEVEIQERMVEDPGDELAGVTGSMKTSNGAFTLLQFEYDEPPP